jgi:hydrogenase nickel incorporation protein HypA/HybF
MHELSIAQSIVEIVEEEAFKNNVHVVAEVEVEVGTLSGIEPDALEFAWEVASYAGVAKGSKLTIRKVQACGRCSECNHEFNVENFYEACPECKNPWFDVIQGREMKIIAIVAE